MASSEKRKQKNELFSVLLNCLFVLGFFWLAGGLFSSSIIQLSAGASGLWENLNVFSQGQANKVLASQNTLEEQSQTIRTLQAKLRDYEYKLNFIQSSLVDLNNLSKLQAQNSFVDLKAEPIARVVTRLPDNWHNEVIIDKGQLEGLALGMSVLTEKGIVGQIKNCQEHFCTVQLLSSERVKLGAIIPRSKVMGILLGRKDGSALLKFVPIGADVKEGDIVQSSGIKAQQTGQAYPATYPIGVVSEVGQSKNGSEMLIVIRPYEDLAGLTRVMIYRGGKQHVQSQK